MKENQALLKSLTQAFLHNNTPSEVFLSNLSHIAFKESYVQTISLNDVKSKLLGIALKLRVQSNLSQGTQLENLVHKMFIPPVSQMKYEMTQLLYYLQRQNTENCELENYEPENYEERNNNLLDWDGQTIFSESKPTISDFSMSYMQDDAFSVYSAAENIEGQDQRVSISTEGSGVENNIITPIKGYELKSLFSVKKALKRVLVSISEEARSSVESKNDGLSQRNDVDVEVGEEEIVQDVLFMMLGTSCKFFDKGDEGYRVLCPKVDWISDGTLRGLLMKFTEYANEIFKVQKIISELLCHSNLSYIALGTSSQKVVLSTQNKISEYFKHFCKSQPSPDIPFSHCTLLVLLHILNPLHEKTKILRQILESSVINNQIQSYNTSYLLSKLYDYSENYALEHFFIVRDLFFDVFMQYVWDITLWMVSATISPGFFIIKQFDNQRKWKNYILQTVQIHGKTQLCIPFFIKSYAQQIYVIGNYYILERGLQNECPESKIFDITANSIYTTIYDSFLNSLTSDIYSLNLNKIIQNSFGNSIEELYSTIGLKVLNVFTNQFNLVNLLNILQNIYFIQDTEFLYIIEEVIEKIQRKEPIYNIDLVINQYFSDKGYDKYFHCSSEKCILKIEQVRIEFSVPIVFDFVLEDSIKKYKEIFHMILHIHLAHKCVKTLNKEHNLIKYRREFINFFDSFEYYAYQTVIVHHCQEFHMKMIKCNEIYPVTKAHRYMIDNIYLKLFLLPQLLPINNLILSIFSCFKELYYKLLANERYDIEDIGGNFSDNLIKLLNVLQRIADSFPEFKNLNREFLVNFEYYSV
ncbi:hypothetical protein SteCoe_18214 [Stentor coeruleus]|uniref:Spindle pole body component n=1 Tax=Stentor coeruleus TaxID=5963 RepID=A0A1R2BX30_9CILI|nr:hypothetical protein SteCoe_18214 [Stentor coeruleus]